MNTYVNSMWPLYVAFEKSTNFVKGYYSAHLVHVIRLHGIMSDYVMRSRSYSRGLRNRITYATANANATFSACLTRMQTCIIK